MKNKINSLLPKITNTINSHILSLYNKYERQQRPVRKPLYFSFEDFLFLFFLFPSFGGKEQFTFFTSALNLFLQHNNCVGVY